MSKMKALSPDQLEAWRDETYFRTPRRQVCTLQEAARFVDENGLSFAFSAQKSELPCLWHAACGCRDPEMPLHTHHDPHLGRLDRWLVPQVETAQSLSPEEGRTAVLAKYFSRVIAARSEQVARLFGWGAAEAGKAMQALLKAGVVTDDVVITDDAENDVVEPGVAGRGKTTDKGRTAGRGRLAMAAGKWYIHTDYC